MWIKLTVPEIDRVRLHARRAELGGKSQIRGSDRRQTLAADQFTAQAGEAALSILLTGNIALYERTRARREQSPFSGDGGSDLIGYPIDVKTSRARYGWQRLYHLWIRPPEYHADTVYYFALMDRERDDVVIFAGWAVGRCIPLAADGRYTLRQDQLNGMELIDFSQAGL